MLLQPDVVLLSFVKYNPQAIWIRVSETPATKRKK